jgi:E3 ubiquitin-protein ligase HERC2
LHNITRHSTNDFPKSCVISIEFVEHVSSSKYDHAASHSNLIYIVISVYIFFSVRSQLLRRVSRGFASSSNTVAFTWGSCDKGRLGNGLTSGTQLLPQVFSLPASEGSPVPAIKKISFGHQHTAVLTSSGDVYTHGSGADYVLGHGSKDSEARPRRVEGLPAGEIVDVACGHHHTLAVTRSGAVYSWGWGGMRVYHLGGLGLGSYADAPRPTRVAGFGDDAKLPRIVQVSAGKYHSIARAADGQVFSWGDGEYGKLGTGSSTGSLVPQPIEFFLPSSQRQSGIRIVHIASGPQFNMAIADDGQLFGFGRNEYGQLGVGSSMTIELSAMESVPTAIALPLGGDASADDAAIVDVACGPRHTIACTSYD